MGWHYTSPKKKDKKKKENSNTRGIGERLRMNTFKSTHTKFAMFYLAFGYNLKRFAIGFCIDRYSVSLDIGPFWFSIER